MVNNDGVRAWAALLGMMVSATSVVLSARANREAVRTGRLRVLFWPIPGWIERNRDPTFFRLGLRYHRIRPFFFAMLTALLGGFFLDALGLLY